MEFLSVKQIAAITRKNEETIRRKIRNSEKDPDNDEKIVATITSTKKGYRVPVDELIKKNILTQEEVNAFLLKTNAEKVGEILGGQTIVSHNTSADKDISVADALLQFDALSQKKLQNINELEKHKQAIFKIEHELFDIDSELKILRDIIDSKIGK